MNHGDDFATSAIDVHPSALRVVDRTRSTGSGACRSRE